MRSENPVRADGEGRPHGLAHRLQVRYDERTDALGRDTTDPFIDASADLLTSYNTFSLEISPVHGTPLVIEKVIPQSLNPVMNLR